MHIPQLSRFGLLAVLLSSFSAAALGKPGVVVSWGSQTIPLSFYDGKRITQVSAGDLHTMALKSDGTVVAWGYNNYGQSIVPAGLSGVVQVSAGDLHTMALKSDGTVVAWGYNYYGQSTVPAGLSGVVQVSAGGYHSLALKSDGTVVAWGYNGYGQSTVPAGLSGVIQVSAGGYHSLALKSDGTVVAWGYNGYGQSTVPAGLSGVIQVSAGGYHSLALKSDGTVVAWGYNGFGQSTVPAGLSGVIQVSAGGLHSLALKSDGTVVAWGSGYYAEGIVPAGLNSVIQVSAGSGHTLALKSDGTVVAWGSNEYGESTVPAGLNSIIQVSAGPGHTLALESDGTVVAWGSTVPAGLSGVVQISAGEIHSLVLKSDGTVVAWGDNYYGESTIPTGLSGVTQASAGYRHNLVLKSDGTVVAWGDNDYGESTVPTSLSGVIQVSAGGYHNLVLKSEGTVVAWGYNNYGEATVPAGLSGVIQVSAGGYHSLALKSDGMVVAWGSNFYGETTVPAGLSGVIQVSAGEYQSLALKSDGTVVAWGDNYQGQTTVPAGLSGVIQVSAGYSHSLALLSPLPVIANVSPNPVPGYNGQQAFTVNGQNFDVNCSVTLRQVSTGEVFPNRAKYSQTANQILLKPNFSTTVSGWTVEVINPDGSSSGQFPFNVSNASVTSLTVNGPPSLAAGASAPCNAEASFSDGSNQDVTSLVSWRVSGGPTGTVMSGNSLQAGKGTAATAVVQALWTRADGQKVQHLSVQINAGLDVALNTPTNAFVSRSANNITYHLSTMANVHGGTGALTAAWTWNGTGIPSQTTAALDANITATAGTGTLGVTVTDASGASAATQIQVTLNKPPVANEPVFQIYAKDNLPGTYYAADGMNGFTFSENSQNGFVVIVHGLDDGVVDQDPQSSPGWVVSMGEAVQSTLRPTPPKVLLYDWHQAANPSALLGLDELDADVKEAAKEARQITGGIDVASLTFEGATSVAQWLAKIIGIRPHALDHGDALAGWMIQHIHSGDIAYDKPIQLIGHSAGGHLIGECADKIMSSSELSAANKVPTKLQVTMLDTPFPYRNHVTDIRSKSGRVELYTSSILGHFAPGLLADADTREIRKAFQQAPLGTLTTPLVIFLANPFIPPDNYFRFHQVSEIADHYFGFVANHLRGHDWYIDSINDETDYIDGFYYSPFFNSPWPGSSYRPAVSQISRNGSNDVSDVAMSVTTQAISGFQTFGNVTTNGSSYTITEQDNAGISTTAIVPRGVQSLKFRLQFSQPGDGDFIQVSFGDGPPVAGISEQSFLDGSFSDFEFPMGQYAGETAPLVFTLISRGQPNAQIIVDQIQFTVSDDADGDGLTNEQEVALGTNPNCYDTDSDGISDGDEVNIYHTNPLKADTDGDGISDADEIAVGTDPLDPKSNLRLTSASLWGGAGFTITWSAKAGKTYEVQRSSDPSFDSYNVIASGINGIEPNTSYTDNSAEVFSSLRMFYRVTLQP